MTLFENGDQILPTEGFFTMLEDLMGPPHCHICSSVMRFLGYFSRVRDGRMERLPEYVCDYCGKTPTESAGFQEKLAA